MAALPLFTDLFEAPSELDRDLALAPPSTDHTLSLSAPAFRQGTRPEGSFHQLWAPQARPVVKVEHDMSRSYLPAQGSMTSPYQAADRPSMAPAPSRPQAFQLPPAASFTRPSHPGQAGHSLLPASSLFDGLAEPWRADPEEGEGELPGGVNEQHFSRSSSPSPPDGDSPVDGQALQSPEFPPVRQAAHHKQPSTLSLFGGAPLVLEADDRTFFGNAMDMEPDLPPSSWSDLALQQQAMHDTFSLDIFYDGAIMPSDCAKPGQGHLDDYSAMNQAALPAPAMSQPVQWFPEQPVFYSRTGQELPQHPAPVTVSGPAMGRAHHQAVKEEADDQVSPSPSPTPGSSSSSGRKRVRHRRRRWTQTQSKRKAYTCESCGLVLQGHSTLVRHMRIHTGEKPFRCEDCGVSFRQKGTLTSHMVTHTGDLPFHCEYCDQRFRHRATMKRHVANMHGGKPITRPRGPHVTAQPAPIGAGDLAH